jgi:plastocyanin
VSAVVLSACGGGGGDHAPAPKTQTPAAADPVATMVPANDTVVVEMIFEGGTAYKFKPSEITVPAGGGILFKTVSGQPHNVAFPPAELPADVRAQLKANMQNQSAELTSPVLLNVGDDYFVSFGGVKAGKYTVTCPLHMVQGMKGTITVQ